jgi:hypothetical protein
MLKHTAFALIMFGLAFAEEYPVEVHLDEVSKVKCMSEVPKDFACAILFNVDPPLFPQPIDIASVAGGGSSFLRTPPTVLYAQVAGSHPPVIREVSLILDGTLYTAVYDPPLKQDDKFSGLGRNVGVPARVAGDDLVIRWPGGKEAKAKIIRREKINPNRPQPA